jgi:hypothetical protein
MINYYWCCEVMTDAVTRALACDVLSKWNGKWVVPDSALRREVNYITTPERL